MVAALPSHLAKLAKGVSRWAPIVSWRHQVLQPTPWASLAPRKSWRPKGVHPVLWTNMELTVSLATYAQRHAGTAYELAHLRVPTHSLYLH